MNLIQRLTQAGDAEAMNKFALEVVDSEAVEAIPLLVSLAKKTNQSHKNGTLLYALSHFDIPDYLPELVGLVVGGASYEACEEMLGIFEHNSALLNPSSREELLIKLSQALNDTKDNENKQYVHGLINIVNGRPADSGSTLK